jgi:type IV secretory pathway TrbF-like protein
MASVDSDPPPSNGHPAVSAEFAELDKAYQILQQRDGSAETRASWWKGVAVAGLVIAFGNGVWDHLDRRRVVEPFVQNVQVTEDGKVLNVGLPQRVLDYTPEDSHIYGMLGQWVTKVRWLGPDPTLAKLQWAWAYLHACGSASQELKAYEAYKQPFDPKGRTVSLELEGWNKTLVPLSYHIHWKERHLSPALPPVEKSFHGIFTVGRVSLTKPEEIYQNPYGMCITAFSISEQPR